MTLESVLSQIKETITSKWIYGPFGVILLFVGILLLIFKYGPSNSQLNDKRIRSGLKEQEIKDLEKTRDLSLGFGIPCVIIGFILAVIAVTSNQP